MRHFFVMLITGGFLTLVACNNGGILNPPVGPNTAYPCGVKGVVCPGQMCCWENEVCGGQPFSGCPADMCCYVGPTDPTDLGAHPNHKQLTSAEMKTAIESKRQ
jgi:hypothetical protein